MHLDDRCRLCGVQLGDSDIRLHTGALVMALRQPDGVFVTNPPPDTVLEAGQVLIAVGTEQQLRDLSELVRS